ncbi:hypothetical protein C9980_05185 [Vibrio mediterranei]|uniref:hypothetical protein n=1 Tax=Vibrio mediterranei TaxID=689 RepID=UPI000D187224|nr:hypothetical protein [Vibrio mediterranei]PTC06138.1 hypothetical protein C9980_05185 [Vibrio mediterranei]
MNKLLVIAITLQLALAFSTDGLTRALAELTAFLLTVVLFFNVKQGKTADPETKRALAKLEKSPKSTTTS